MADAAVHDHDDRSFFARWFMPTNYKDIGLLYLLISGLAGFVAVLAGLLHRSCRSDRNPTPPLTFGTEFQMLI